MVRQDIYIGSYTFTLSVPVERTVCIEIKQLTTMAQMYLELGQLSYLIDKLTALEHEAQKSRRVQTKGLTLERQTPTTQKGDF